MNDMSFLLGSKDTFEKNACPINVGFDERLDRIDRAVNMTLCRKMKDDIDLMIIEYFAYKVKVVNRPINECIPLIIDVVKVFSVA